MHVHSKRTGQLGGSSDFSMDTVKDPYSVDAKVQKINRASLSIPLSPESSDLREELAKVAVLSLEEGFVN